MNSRKKVNKTVNAAIAAAPDHVDDPDCPYNQTNDAEVIAYWSKVLITSRQNQVTGSRR